MPHALFYVRNIESILYAGSLVNVGTTKPYQVPKAKEDAPISHDEAPEAAWRPRLTHDDQDQAACDNPVAQRFKL